MANSRIIGVSYGNGVVENFNERLKAGNSDLKSQKAAVEQATDVAKIVSIQNRIGISVNQAA